MKDLYEVEIRVDTVFGIYEVSITGEDLIALKSCILPIVKQHNRAKGYKTDFAYITTDISKNGEYIDHDEDEFDLTVI